MGSFPHSEISTWTRARLLELRQLPRRPDRYALTLVGESGDEVRVVVSDELVLRAGVRSGEDLSDGQLAGVQRDARLIFARDKALAALARRSRTRREIETMLRRHSVAPADIQLVAAELTRAGHLDDARVAEAFVRARVASSGASVWLLRRDLARKGVSREVADEAISAVMADETVSEIDLARREAEKKLRSLSRFETPVVRRRLAAHLQRRGFSGAVVRELIRELTMPGSGGHP